jgi:hypothetical protein
MSNCFIGEPGCDCRIRTATGIPKLTHRQQVKMQAVVDAARDAVLYVDHAALETALIELGVETSDNGSVENG